MRLDRGPCRFGRREASRARFAPPPIDGSIKDAEGCVGFLEAVPLLARPEHGEDEGDTSPMWGLLPQFALLQKNNYGVDVPPSVISASEEKLNEQYAAHLRHEESEAAFRKGALARQRTGAPTPQRMNAFDV